MKVLSIDVGIRNLAYCIVEADVKSKTISGKKEKDINLSIVSWDVLNLTENNVTSDAIKSDNKANKCFKCKYVGKYITPDDKLVCKRHAKDYIMPLKKWKTQAQREKLSLKQLEELAQMCNITTSSMFFKTTTEKQEGNTRANTKEQKRELLELCEGRISKHLLREIPKKKNTKELDLVTIGKNMCTCFEQSLPYHDFDLILIENQISPIANRMKTIQGMITQYFIMKGDNKNIVFVSSSLKLKPFAGEKAKYKDRKTLSIQIIKNLCDEEVIESKWQEHFTLHKKKDDLADTYLQAYAYLLYH